MSENRKIFDIVIVALLVICIAISSVTYINISKIPALIDSIKPTEPEVLPSIRIGYIATLTGGGAFYAGHARAGAQIAVDKINENGGLIMPEGRRRIELLFEDSKGIAAEAVSAAKKLIERDKVSLLCGAWYSSNTLAILPILEEKSIPMIIDASTNWKVTAPVEKGGARNEWGFRIITSDEQNSRAVANKIVDLFDVENIAILASNNDWGLGVVESYKPKYEELGANIAYEGVYEPATVDFYSHILKIQDSNPDLLHYIGHAEEIVPFITQYRELAVDIPIIALGSSSSKVLDLAGEDIIGVWDIARYNPDFDNPENNILVQEVQKRYGYDPDMAHNFGYSVINIAAEAIVKVGTDDPIQIREALEEITWLGPTGLIDFDEYHQASPHLWLTQIQLVDGELVLGGMELSETQSVDWTAIP